MGRRGAVLGIAALVVAALLMWWLTREAASDESLHVPRPAGATAPQSPPALPALPTPAGGSAPSLLDAAGDPSGAPAAGAPAASESPAVLTVVVHRRADDSAVAEAEVRLAAAITDTDPITSRRFNGRTAADGTCRIEFDHSVNVFHVEVLSGSDHAHIEEFPHVSIALGESKELRLDARRGATVRGVVVDEGQRPVSEAGVLAWCDRYEDLESDEGPMFEPDARAVCDSAGRFELRGMGPNLVLMPEASGMAAQKGVSGMVAEGTLTEEVTLVLCPARELRGRVLDSSGQPVAGTRVQASRTVIRNHREGLDRVNALRVGRATDADGRFALTPLARLEWQVSVRAQGFLPWSRAITPDGGELLIQLSAGLGLSGVVYGADGAPLDGAAVLLGGASELRPGDFPATVTKTEDGRFSFSGLVPTQTGALGVTAPGHAIVVVEPVVVTDAPAPPLEIRLEPEHLIGGRVVDEDEQPIEGATIRARGDRQIQSPAVNHSRWEWWVWPESAFARSDADGRFRLERLYDGIFELSVEDPRGEGLEHAQIVQSGVEDLVIQLDAALLRRAVLTGTVRDAESGAPIDDFRISMGPEEEERRQSEMSRPWGNFEDAAGDFVLQGIEPGRWSLQADAQGHASALLTGLELRGGEQHVDVSLLPSRSLQMRVVDQDGEPVGGAHVHFEDARSQRIVLQSDAVGNGTIGMTDKAGELTAQDLPSDRITIVLKLWLVSGAAVGRREIRLPVDLRVQPQGVQEFTIERRRVRCLVLGLAESGASTAETVFDTSDDQANETLKSLAEQDALHPSQRPIIVTVTDASGAIVDTAQCEPNSLIPERWRVTSSVCSSESEPNSWLATALPAGPSRAVVAAEGCEPVTLDLPGGEAHLKRYVILRPVAPQH